MEPTNGAREAVMSYAQAMDKQDYDTVRTYLSDNVLVKGPAGEAFRSPDAFVEMMRKFPGKYDIKKAFADGNDVCLLYNFITPSATVFFCSWYRVKGGKIISIQSVFDPRPFASAQGNSPKD